MYREFITFVVTALLAYLGGWAFLGAYAFRRGEEEALGRMSWWPCAAMLAAGCALELTRSRYLPDPILLGILGGGLAAIAIGDRRLWLIPNPLVAALALAGIIDGFARGRIVDVLLGVVAAALVLGAAYRFGIIKEGDLKAGLAVSAVLGGLFGVVAIMLGILGVLIAYEVQKSRSRLPVTTRLPWSPLLALGTLGALVASVLPVAGYLVAVRP